MDYGHLRSRSAAFGEAVVQIGEGLSWDDIVEASRAEKRSQKLEIKVTATQRAGDAAGGERASEDVE